jgi:hypothetical protein
MQTISALQMVQSFTVEIKGKFAIVREYFNGRDYSYSVNGKSPISYSELVATSPHLSGTIEPN